MKKKILILAAVAVSGLAAVVASNFNKFEKDAEAGCKYYEERNLYARCRGSRPLNGCIILTGPYSYIQCDGSLKTN